MVRKITTDEIAAAASDPWVPAYTGLLRPEDETLARRGGPQGVALYDEIRRDPHALALLQKRTLEVVRREWRVDAASDRRIDKRAAEIVTAQLRSVGMDGLTKGLMGAVLKGYAAAEIMWERQGGLWVATAAKARNQRRFRFDASGAPRLLTRSNMIAGMDLPDRKFIVHRYTIHDHDDDPYGCGIGSSLYWPAWFKRQALAAWLQHVETHADPLRVAHYEGGTVPEDERPKIVAQIKALARNKVVMLPRGIDLDQLEAGAGGSAGYQALLEYLDEMMAVAVLGETLTTSAGDQGSRALGEVHNDVRIAIAKADADLVCDTINRSLVRWICEVNALPIGDGYPQVWRDFGEPEDLDRLSARDERLDRMGYRAPVTYINDTYGGDRLDTRATPAEGQAPTVPPIDPAFAEAASAIASERVPEVLADRLLAETADARRDLLERVRAVVMSATSYDDLAVMLLEALPGLDVSAMADIMADAMAAADLIGRSAVITEGDDDGDS